jgi:hypothetical protein
VYVIGHWYYGVRVEETRKELSYLRTMGAVTSEGNFNKSIFEEVEGVTGLFGKVEGDAFVREAGKRDDDVGIVVDESMVEIGEAEEGLDVFDFPWLRPVTDGLDLVGSHE